MTTQHPIFISFRFAEAQERAKQVKQGLESRGIPTYLANVDIGKDIADEVLGALANCKLVVIMGTKTYGTKTASTCSTHEEFNLILEDKIEIFPIKMCDRFDVPKIRTFINQDRMSAFWKSGPMPDDLIDQIVEKLRSVSVFPQHGIFSFSSIRILTDELMEAAREGNLSDLQVHLIAGNCHIDAKYDKVYT